jgi:uncharacterized NAD(P)/FAD-binding protein YdhS
MVVFAIIGLGPWGLCVLERTISRARSSGVPVRLHLVEPGRVGGVYATDQPDYLVLNNPCGQLSLFTNIDDELPPYALTFFDWVRVSGYRRIGEQYVIGDAGELVASTDYLPRRLMGEYLAWMYDVLMNDLPANLEVVRHFASASDIELQLGGKESITLDNGTSLTVDHVVMTTGHTTNVDLPHAPGAPDFLPPYPVEDFNATIAPGDNIAIAGMGLVSFDLLAAFTTGRGGLYVGQGAQRHYQPSGREPHIYLYSRSGVPYCAKAAHGVDSTGQYQPVVCTPSAIQNLIMPVGATRQHVDFRRDILPLIFAEMSVRYFEQSAAQNDGAEAADAVRQQLVTAWREGDFTSNVEKLQSRYGPFDPYDNLFADTPTHFASDAEYQEHMYGMIEADLHESLSVSGSPVKAAQEVTRILRDQLRDVIEFGGLSLESYVDFQTNVRGKINRIEAGPPALRSQQLLALLDAGIVQMPFGPRPELEVRDDGEIVIRSTALDQPVEHAVAKIIRGHLDMPSLARSRSTLLKQLYAKGRLTQFSYGDTAVGSVAIDESFHPYDAEDRIQSGITLLGVLTEGVRYFTHYLPSPKSRIRAIYDAQSCVDAILTVR